jgi:hypothetical protein
VDPNRSTSPPTRDVTIHVRSHSDNPPTLSSSHGLIEEEEVTSLTPPRVSRSITAPRLPNRSAVESAASGDSARAQAQSSGTALRLSTAGEKREREPPGLQALEDSWNEFLAEVKWHVKQQTLTGEKQEQELHEKIRLKSSEIEELKKRIQEVSARLEAEDKMILKYENENCELSMKILDYQLLALKK